MDDNIRKNEKFDDKKEYVIVEWYFQQHGSFSSGGRSRDISLRHFSSSQQLRNYFFEYIENNYQHRNLTWKQSNIVDLCRIAIEESNQLLLSNKEEISRVTSRHIWPSNHKLLMGCFIDAYILGTCSHQQRQYENNDMNYCLITELGNHPTHVKFVCGNDSLREEILQRFQNPFRTNFKPSQEQIDLFLHQTQILSIEQLCNYVTSPNWQKLNVQLYGTIVDFIIVGQILLFNEQII